MYQFIPTTDEHIEMLLEDIRDEDKAEAAAMDTFDLKSLLRDNIKRSVECWTCLVDEGVVAIFGVIRLTLLSDSVCPWMATTNLVYKHKKAFLKCTKLGVEFWANKYKNLESFIDARYDKALRWAKWVGFTIHPAKPYGPYGNLFHKTELRV